MTTRADSRAITYRITEDQWRSYARAAAAESVRLGRPISVTEWARQVAGERAAAAEMRAARQKNVKPARSA